MTPRRDPLPDPLWKLDLHGSTPDRALDRVRQEIVLRQRHGQSPILIITGKGLHSSGGKSTVQQEVKRLLHSPEGRALGVKNVQPAAGGGAFRVDLLPLDAGPN
jgi:DNA-nicking Smr family endonuclease